MIVTYKDVDSFEEIAEDARQEIAENESQENYLLPYQITRENLISNKLADVEDEASHWASEDRPSHLFFSHGEYRVGGLQHVSDELKRKPTSNRALYSLINQKDITDSEDKPIPSFMVFQCLLVEDEKELYVSVFFRALEVSTFLRINLEEIRQNIAQIYRESIDFERVKLLIVAGRAHHSPGHIPLERPKIDALEQVEMLRMLERKRTKIRELLMEKARTQSVINFESLKNLRVCLQDEEIEIIPVMMTELDEAIDLSKELQRYREKGSQSPRVSEVNAKLKETLEQLAKRFVDE